MKTKIKGLFTIILVAVLFNTTIANPSITISKILKVDTQNSKLCWKGRKHNGDVLVAGGSIIMQNEQLKGGNFDIDLKSIKVTNQADNGVLLQQLKSNDFFAVDRFPKAMVVFSSVNFKGDDKYEITGKLTVKGITKDVAFPAILKFEKGKYITYAKIEIEYSNYGIKYHAKNLLEDIYARFMVKSLVLDVSLATI